MLTTEQWILLYSTEYYFIICGNRRSCIRNTQGREIIDTLTNQRRLKMLGALLLVSLACLGAEGALPPNTGRWVIVGGLNGETPSAQVL
jgi:hypothetical protein